MNYVHGSIRRNTLDNARGPFEFSLLWIGYDPTQNGGTKRAQAARGAQALGRGSRHRGMVSGVAKSCLIQEEWSCQPGTRINGTSIAASRLYTTAYGRELCAMLDDVLTTVEHAI